jgi:hypothetical protein
MAVSGIKLIWREMVFPYLISQQETTIERSGKKVSSKFQGSLNPFPWVNKMNFTINVATLAK